MDNVSRDMEIVRKESKRNAGDKKHCNRNKALDGLISRLEMAEKRISP